jgi:methyl-accepting chemotaxis protein
MNWLSNIQISRKVPAIIVLAAAVMGIGIGLMSYMQASSAVHEQIQTKFFAVLEARKASFEAYLGSVEEDMNSLAANPLVMEASYEFNRSSEEFRDDVTAELQRLYIDENPEANRKDLVTIDGNEYYGVVHEQYHPWFRTFLDERGYHDIFLIDPNGVVVYSVSKESDFGTNVLNGQWKDTALRSVYETAMAAEKGDIAYQDFTHYAPSGNSPNSFIASPIVDRAGRKTGVLVFQLPVNKVNRQMNIALGLGETGETLLVGQDYKLRNDSRFSSEPTTLKAELAADAVKTALEAGKPSMSTDENLRGMTAETFAVPFTFQGVPYAIVAQISTDEAYADLVSMRWIMLGTALVLVIAVAGAGVFASRDITAPISRLTHGMSELAEGNTNIDMSGLDRGDEIGDMSKAVEIFRNNAIERAELEEENKREEAAKEARAKNIDKLIADFETSTAQMLGAVSAAATEMENTAHAMTSTADTANAKAGAVAAASEEASANVQTVASAAEQLSAAIEEIRRQVLQSNSVGERAANTANSANTKIEGLSEAARQIGEVVTLIQDIAEQTNLLALNATIEAARAGEAGKGFAVVASEVKELANQTAKATEEISQQIGSVQTSTSDAVDAIREVTTTVSEMREIAQTIASSVEQQQSATVEISRNVQEAAHSSDEVAQNIAEVTVAANESSGAAGQVLSAAGELAGQSDKLKSSVDKFLREVRSA